MNDELRYDGPQRHPAVVTDRWGRFETTLVNDGQTFELLVRGHRFAGRSLDGLESDGTDGNPGPPPDLHQSDLCSCSIEWTMPVRVAVAGEAITTVDLSLRLPTGDIT